jgi:hypothetical protein
MIKGSNTIAVHDRDPVEGLDLCLNSATAQDRASAAQLQVWHAQSQRDRMMISGKEMEIVERLAGQVAGESKSIYNPYTREIRKTFLPDWLGKWQKELNAPKGII